MIEGIGAIPLWLACAGIVFLALDLNRIDERDRVPQAVFARPVANVQLVLARLSALAGSACVSLLILALAIQAIGIASQLLDWPMGGPVESASLVRFIVVESMPAIVIFTGFVLLLTVRGNWVLAIVPLIALSTQIYILFHAPAYLRPAISIVGSLGGTASDFLPEIANLDELFRAGCSILTGVGLCVIAAELHPRLDTIPPMRTLAAGLAFALAGFIGIAYLARSDLHEVAEKDRWVEAHASLGDQQRADVERISAQIGIDPGERLTVEAIFHLALPAKKTTTELVMSANPSIRIEEVRLNNRTTSFRHELGILTVIPDEELDSDLATLFVKSNGVPDPNFAYLDSALDAQRASLAESQLHLLGTQASIFSRHYVALMPGVRWLPLPGANYHSNIAEQPIRDFFELDLEVTVPSDWIAVGPGPPVEIDRRGSTHTYRFRPATALTDFGIFASSLLSRHTLVVNGTKFELLLHPEHQRNVDYIGTGVVEHYVGVLKPEALDSLADFFFPYGGLSIVEVPSTLRGYGGGWRLDSVLGLPGIILIREHGLPTARLASPWGDNDTYRTLYLGDYLDRDYGGGNLVSAVARHLLDFRTSPIGDESIALDVLLELLAAGLFEQTCHCTFGGDRQLFSAHRFHSPSFGQPVFSAAMARIMGNTSEIRAERERTEQFHTQAWDIAERLSVSQLVTVVRPEEAIGALQLKIGKMAELLTDTLGVEKLTSLFRELLKKHGGSSFSARDLDAIGTALGAPFQPLVNHWFNGTTLPGFLVSPITVSRLADDASDKPRYQATVHVRNDETVPGHIKLTWHASPPDEYGTAGPFRVEGKTSAELGFISASPPKWVNIDPYLSLNRDRLRIETSQDEPVKSTKTKPFSGVRSSNWLPPQDGIVVDDLDPGFSIVRAKAAADVVDSLTRNQRHGIYFDGGVPIYPMCCGTGNGKWQRDYEPWAWGKYRRTFVRASRGQGEEVAVFSTELPHAGPWRLHYHLPGRFDWRNPGAAFRHENLGRFTIVISSNEHDISIVFDGSTAHHGWNDLGIYDLAAGAVRVQVSSTTDEQLAVSDAIRFTPTFH